MIGALILTALLQDKPASQESDPGVIISKVFQKYYNARTLSGTIVQTIGDGGGTKKYTTQVNYVRPGKINVQQDFVAPNGLKANLTSNGTVFVYDPPYTSNFTVKPRERLYEKVTLPKAGTYQQTVLSLGDMYHAAHLSLAPSTLLDLAIAYKKHLEDFTINVKEGSYSLVGVETFEGKSSYHIRGLWQSYRGALPSGQFDLWVSLEFDLQKFVLKENYMVDERTKQTVLLTVTETANLTIGATVSEALFRVDVPK